ncbi:MAG: cyclic nucleotide-binding domain-containing protein [Rhodobacteraceae bacterium]|nr:MAG: cyclic nucleotide-binding domain-containing protein [Paracoccaceae bacterium]
MGDLSAEQLMNMAGLAGVVLYLGSYALLQSGILRGSSYTYAILNLCAASLVLLSLTVAFNLSSAIIQASWIVISMLGIARLIWINRRVRFTAEEKAMLQDVFPDIPRAVARRFLDRGNWIDAEEGALLLGEGEPVANLYYLAKGQVNVNSGGQVIGKAKSGLLGEMNVLSGGPASASVMAATPARLFVISSEALQRFAARDSDFRILLENGMSRDTGRKLMRANQRLSALREHET